MTVVVDASITIAWVFPGENNAAAEAALRRVASEGALVPSLWRLEIANVLRNAVRRSRCTQRYARGALAYLNRLQIFVDGETDKHAWSRTWELSTEHDLTVYDATYLELAMRRHYPFASFDAALIKAAKRARLEVLSG